MALQKQNLNIPFAVSLDLKTDPFQLSPDKMLSVVNAVYTNDKKLSKRNGYAALPNLPSTTNATTLTTFNDNLLAIGNNVQVYNKELNQWLNKGFYQPITLNVQSVVRSSSSQSKVDISISNLGVACSVFIDGSTPKYQIFDSKTTQIYVNPTVIPGTSVTKPRAFTLGNYFIITFIDTVSGTAYLKYISIPLNNLTSVTGPTVISNSVGSTTSYDGMCSANDLYLAWCGADVGGALRYTFIDKNLNQYYTNLISSITPSLLSVFVDSSSNMWISYNTTGKLIYTTVVDRGLNSVLAPTYVGGTGAEVNLSLTTSVVGTTLQAFWEVQNSYAFNSEPANILRTATCTITGTTTSPIYLSRNLGLGSKAFVINNNSYVLCSYEGVYQPTYFLLNSSGGVIAKLAYSNGAGYVGEILPTANVSGTTVSIGYLFKDLIESVNKSQNAPSVNNIYSQTGINLASINLSSSSIITAEIGQNLHITGGFVWMYDGNSSYEHNFHYWPEGLGYNTATTGGSMANQLYYYQAVYEWTDAQGNIHRSAPSVPLKVDISSSGTSTNEVTVQVPCLNLTYKNGVRVCLYRWSTAQQNYYEVTSITSPLLNDPTIDFVAFLDTQADSAIIGNPLIYTTGGVVENIAYPACNIMSLYKSRLMVLDAEEPNTVWFSKQVIQAVPVEPSDLFTIYIAPTISVQGSTGQVTAMAALDDKFITFKKDAAYYIVGNGPDNLGANNDFSDPVFIIATVGCSNQRSIAFIPPGLMFQSDKGIWLLERNLNTSYIGAAVEGFNSNLVTSAINPTGTNQIRFCLDNGQALMYDYFYGRWGSFSNIPSISSTLQNSLHVYLRADGLVLVETPNLYLDNGAPVLMSFQTAWYNLAGLQGYERFYYFYILGQFLSPNKLSVQIAYDYNPTASQSTLITATNYQGPYGSGSYFGDQTPYGGPSPIEQWRIFAQRQKCQAFQISVNEIYDSEFSTTPSAGLTFNGLNLVYGLKKGYHPQPNSSSAG